MYMGHHHGDIIGEWVTLPRHTLDDTWSQQNKICTYNLHKKHGADNCPSFKKIRS